MKIVIMGATGFIGSHLCRCLSKDYEVVSISRSPRPSWMPDSVRHISANTTIPGAWQKELSDAHVVVNLVGKSIFCPWTKKNKKKLYQSRILSTKNAVEAIKEETLLINASAVGIYGDRKDEVITEKTPEGSGFLADICRNWEKEAKKAKKHCILRLGTVFSPDGGALKLMIRATKLGFSAVLGSGEQWISWIHMEDVIRAVKFIIENQMLGVVNLVSPNPVRQKDIAAELARAYRRPLIKIPASLFKLLGEQGRFFISSQRVIPERLIFMNFQFLYPDLEKITIPHGVKEL